jgi:hypothetical protein
MTVSCTVVSPAERSRFPPRLLIALTAELPDTVVLAIAPPPAPSLNSRAPPDAAPCVPCTPFPVPSPPRPPRAVSPVSVSLTSVTVPETLAIAPACAVPPIPPWIELVPPVPPVAWSPLSVEPVIVTAAPWL